MGLSTLVSKMPFLVIILIGGLAQVPIFLMRWPVADTITIVSSRDIGCVDPNGWGGALRPGDVGVAIATISIAPTLLVVPARSFGLAGLGAMRRHGSCLMKLEQKGALVTGIILGRF